MNSFPENSQPEPQAKEPPFTAGQLSIPEPIFPAWDGWDIGRILLMLLIAFLVTFVVLFLAVRGAALRKEEGEISILAQVAIYVFLLGYMYVLVTRERGQLNFWQALRWNPPSSPWFYLLTGFFLQVVFILAEATHLIRLQGKVPFDILLKRTSTVVLLSLFAVTLGPLIEELFFRGFLYPVLRRHLTMSWSVLVTAAPFALMHLPQYGYSGASVVLIFIVGVVLGVVREKQNSLAASFLVHIGYNGTIVLGMFIATDGWRHLEKLNQ